MKLHIFVATTQGLVAIQNITTINDADISSIVSINGTSTTANISSAYHSFVKKGAGILQQDFGACSYRLNISKRIDQGNSWQLAFYLAHAAKSENILGDGQVSAGDHVICATGEVNTTSREVQAVHSISRKQLNAANQIKLWHKSKIKVSFLMPKNNAQDIDKKLPLNIKLVENLAQALSYLPLPSVKISANTNQSNNAVLLRTSKRLLVFTVLSFIILMILFTGYWYANENNELETNKVKSTALKQTSEQQIPSLNLNTTPWQVVILSKPTDEIDENLRPAFLEIEKKIAEQLIENHFEIADKALLTSTHNTAIKNTTEESMSLLHQTGINLAIRFDLTTHKLKNQPNLDNKNTVTWQYQLSTYLIDLATKRKVDMHTEQAQYSSQFQSCDNQCFANWHASNVKNIAQDLGAIIVVKLKNLPRRYQFELTFQNFLSTELILIHNQLKEVPGFLNSHLLKEFSSQRWLLHKTSSQRHLYSTYLSADELTKHLISMLEQRGLTVTPYRQDATSLIFTRNNPPYLFYYLFSIIIFMVLFLSLFTFLFIAKRRWQMTLALRNNIDERLPILTNNTEALKLNENIEDVTTNNQDIKPMTGSVIGTGALKNHLIFVSETLILGRYITEPKASFAIGYQQISQAGKQCLFSYENNHFYLEDQGSTNGCILNNIALHPHKKYELTQDSTLLLGGDLPNNLGICQLDIKIDKHLSSVLIMQLNAHNHQFITLDNDLITWPSMRKDLSSYWVWLKKEVSLSLENGHIKLGSDKSEIIAFLVYQQGFYIKPITSAQSTLKAKHSIMVNQEVVHAIRAIPENAIVSLNGHTFSLQSL